MHAKTQLIVSWPKMTLNGKFKLLIMISYSKIEQKQRLLNFFS